MEPRTLKEAVVWGVLARISVVVRQDTKITNKTSNVRDERFRTNLFTGGQLKNHRGLQPFSQCR
jgi:hypothetical protein